MKKMKNPSNTAKAPKQQPDRANEIAQKVYNIFIAKYQAKISRLQLSGLLKALKLTTLIDSKEEKNLLINKL